MTNLSDVYEVFVMVGTRAGKYSAESIVLGVYTSPELADAAMAAHRMCADDVYDNLEVFRADLNQTPLGVPLSSMYDLD